MKRILYFVFLLVLCSSCGATKKIGSTTQEQRKDSTSVVQTDTREEVNIETTKEVEVQNDIIEENAERVEEETIITEFDTTKEGNPIKSITHKKKVTDKSSKKDDQSVTNTKIKDSLTETKEDSTKVETKTKETLDTKVVVKEKKPQVLPKVIVIGVLVLIGLIVVGVWYLRKKGYKFF